MSRGSTQARGLGWAHRQQRERLLRAHHDGDPCPCLEVGDCGPACPCRAAGFGLPMYRDPQLNGDRMPLEADHTIARSSGGQVADRLLLATCNRSRGAGHRPTTEIDATAMARPSWWTEDWI